MTILANGVKHIYYIGWKVSTILTFKLNFPNCNWEEYGIFTNEVKHIWKDKRLVVLWKTKGKNRHALTVQAKQSTLLQIINPKMAEPKTSYHQ